MTGISIKMLTNEVSCVTSSPRFSVTAEKRATSVSTTCDADCGPGKLCKNTTVVIDRLKDST